MGFGAFRGVMPHDFRVLCGCIGAEVLAFPCRVFLSVRGGFVDRKAIAKAPAA